ncbi:hypothetical protein RXV86_17555 [Alisedimentitalea sp. MJ-SS2]|uniref:c-type cytochrome n=1 Tax=Aliisedimentitalea sp. MJ-SS2 TaxID=3049795 RepID=UPI00290B800D|nr:hypothetical protein [Alisedimentitalea sp. MJ-SS2]MDU8929203.1 hypothetical protein [Alisedimentitalea sp. MJ-SS2]
MIDTLMRQGRVSTALAALLTVSVTPDARAADNIATVLAGPCTACHGVVGNSNGMSMPSLAGMDFYYFFDTMRAYQSGKRSGTIMNRIAKGYSEDQLEIMGDYFESMSFQPAKQEFDADLAARGKELHQNYCQESCHKNGGEGTEESGMLAGQWVTYLSNAFYDMQEGRSEQSPKMNAKVKSLFEEQGEDAFEALLHYYASQQ